MSNTKCILFDFFGTLTEYENSTVIFEEMFVPLKGFLTENEIRLFAKLWLSKYEEYVDQAVRTLNEFSMYSMVEEFTDIFSGIPKKLLHEVVDIFMNCWQQKVHVCKDTLITIPRLSKSYVLGIVSNTHYKNIVPDILSTSGLKQYFDAVILSVETKRRKPCKSIFQNAMDILNMKPEDCCFVGDNYNEDIIGAENVGMKAVQICRRNKEKHENRNFECICDLYELEALLINNMRSEPR